VDVYFGCRHPKRDLYYDDEWAQLVLNGTVGQFITAFSRYDDQAGELDKGGHVHYV